MLAQRTPRREGRSTYSSVLQREGSGTVTVVLCSGPPELQERFGTSGNVCPFFVLGGLLSLSGEAHTAG